MSLADVNAAFAALEAHRQQIADHSVSDLFKSDPTRFETFSVRLDDLLFDYSKHRLTHATLDGLARLARAAGIEDKRDKMFAGAIVNPTENRPALHTALRNFSGRPVMVEGRDVMADVQAVQARVAAFATAIREGTTRGATGKPFAHIVNIGIGGSDLGPAMAARALSPFIQKGLTAHFVSNVDGADIADTLKTLDPAETLFIVSSKTFTTQETMTNAASARAFVANALGEAAVADHFCAVSTRLDKVAAFGIKPERVFGFWDWVGGRYSIWSSIGLSLVIAIGPAGFEQFLRGAYAADVHFKSAPVAQNIPVLMALIGVWYRNICGYATQAVIPYDQRLARFPAYLQQLDMESNGKSMMLDGARPTRATGPIVWGEPGTNGQHAFFQLLHQGTEVVPIDFIAAARPTEADDHHHDLLLANCFAQSEALMRGRSLEEAETQMRASGTDRAAIAEVAPHRVFSGNRPSTTILYDRLTPFALGRLIALYEHRVFCMAAIWNIDPFDQWGVELGKELASRLAPIVQDASHPLDALDGSTAGLIAHMRHRRAT